MLKTVLVEFSILKIALIEWAVVNGCALVVWLFALRCAGLKRRLRVLPVLKLLHKLDLTLMERIGFVVALSVTALPVCCLATGAAVILLALPLSFSERMSGKPCCASCHLCVLQSCKEAPVGAGMGNCRISERQDNFCSPDPSGPIRDGLAGLHCLYAGTAFGLTL